MGKAVKKFAVKSAVAGLALLSMAGCTNSSYWYPQEARGPSGPNCCFAYDDYPPYLSSYYEPANPYGFSIGPHQHMGFSGTVRPGFKEDVNLWDGTGRLHNAYEVDGAPQAYDQDQGAAGYKHHHHKHWDQQGNSSPSPEHTQGAGQNNSYGRDNTGERPQ